MPVIFNEEQKAFHLQSNKTSYIMQLDNAGRLAHLYWGKRINNCNINYLGVVRGTNHGIGEKANGDELPQEYPSYGTGDFRSPAFQVQLQNGSTICDLYYKAHKIFKGKLPLTGLPATYVEKAEEAETIEITMVDELTGLEVILSYTVFEELNAITRSVKFINNGDKSLKLLRVLSASVDFDNDNYEFLNLSGAWCREARIIRRELVSGEQVIESRRGLGGHQQNPFVALLSKGADEVTGEVYGFNLAYSGNFMATAEVDQFNTTRISIGITPFDFSWQLEPGESFQAPEVVLVYSANGLGEMSRTYHKLYRTRLCRGTYRDKIRPILVNNWEATYFHFNDEKILSIAKAGKELGIELFVLDDGWFGKRNLDNCSLGDWVVDRNKLPNGLEDVVKKVTDMDIRFGLWFEPEMVSPDSDLYRKHPDWCLHVPDRQRSAGRFQRTQLVLDLSRKDVCDEIIKMVSDVLKSAPITYVKWDMNRPMTEIGSAALPPERQRETAHRYMLGLYRVIGEITAAFPHVLFESCASGGGRFDPAMLYYMPQTWTSDDSDAVERLKIQYGTSLVYPPITMGAHVSTVPNHQVGRLTGMDIRGNVAMSGNFGYELDLTKFDEETKELVKQQVESYKEIRHIIQFGEFYRIMNPFEGNHTAWMFITEDKKEAVVMYSKVLAEPHTKPIRVKLQGLNPNLNYEVDKLEVVLSGEHLMNIGINMPKFNGDFGSALFKLKAIE